jgi:hypothetical protein
MSIVAVLAASSLLAMAPEPRTGPEVFAPGEISGPVSVDAATFTPDGQTVFFDESVGAASTIMVSSRRQGVWSVPQIAPFSGRWSDKDPSMAPDGSFLIFGSNRPPAPGGKILDAVHPDGKVSVGQGNHLWRVDRKGSGWSAPVRLPDEINDSGRIFSASVVGDGSVYFQRPDPASLTFHIFRSQYRDGRYQAPTMILIGPASADQRDPAVAPDESFMVFSGNYTSRRGANRLYIAFRKGDGWEPPIDLGDAINHDGAEGPHLGPGARTVYYDSSASTTAAFPRSSAQAQRDVARARRWDNGNSHLWRVSLTPWLNAHRGVTP